MYSHREAFCLMKYRDKEGNEEIIWNSRDGVTPFCVVSRQGHMAEHVDWKEDVRNEDYDPPPGSRIFMDLTLEDAIADKRALVERFWDNEMTPMSALFPSKEAAVADLANAEMASAGAPILVEVNEAVRAQIREQRERRKNP